MKPSLEHAQRIRVVVQVLNLLSDLRRDLGLTLMFISHDLGVIEYLCETMRVMYLGTMVESGPTAARHASGRPLGRLPFRGGVREC